MWTGAPPAVDVFIPVYDEPVAVVEPTVRAATAMTGAEVQIHLLDDGASDEMALMARRHGAGYLRREDSSGAKAGNINHALGRTDAPFVMVLDCDHVPEPHFLEATLGWFEDDERMAFVQAPQYYANWDRGEVPAAAWAQQALFFGPIARGKDGHDAMFCCGTNVVFRRARAGAGRRLPGGVGDRGLRALGPPARARLALPLRAGGAGPRARPGGHGLLREPAAALVARLPVGAADRARARRCPCA